MYCFRGGGNLELLISNFKRQLKIYCAFTLAEILITIGIIGIIAALTIPNILSNYRKKVVETRLMKFYSGINQAIQMSEKDNGPKEYWSSIGVGFATGEDGNIDKTHSLPMDWFNKYLKNYLKYTTVKVNDVAGNVMVYFPDGSLCLFNEWSFQFWPEAKDYKEYGLDNSGNYTNNAELSGIKYFTFLFLYGPNYKADSYRYHYQKGVEPYKSRWDGSPEMLKSDPTIGCRKEVTNERAYCAALIQLNGWKIPKDYPLRF